MSVRLVAFLLAVLFVASCGGERHLLRLGATSEGPDEFRVIPAKPLQQPASLTTLPEPTPGGTNLADATPKADAVNVLGGNAAVLASSGIPAADSALVSHVSRYGVDPAIRQELAAADAAMRKRRGVTFLSGLFGGNPYYRLYRNWALDAAGELARLRALGVKTPSAPPN